MYVQVSTVVISNLILHQLMLLPQKVVNTSSRVEDEKESVEEPDAKVKNVVILFAFALGYIQITHPCLQRLKVSVIPQLQRRTWAEWPAAPP